jgi:hypothetical protein
MAEFHEIGSSQFTDVTPTGEEKIQISASQRTTLQNIANLAPEKEVKQVVVTNFQTNTWKLRDGGNVSFPTDIKVGEIVTFTSAQDAVKGPGVELFGYAIKHNSLIASYVGMTTSNKVNGIPTIYTYKSAGAYATAWQQLPDASVKTVEITDFAIPGLNITKDGESFLFYANNASNIPNSNHGATSFVGVAIASPIFITGDQRLLYYMMIDTAMGMFYTGRANLGDDVVAWNDTPVTRLGQAVQVTAFTEGALSSLLYTYKAGDFIPFYTSSVTASEANQFPESGVFNGFISMGRNEGDYFQILAFKTGSTKAYLGACIGSTTQWTALDGGGAQTVIKLPGLDVELNESNGGIITYKSVKLARLTIGVTLMLCFEIADADGRFSPSGNVVVYYDLPPVNNSWKTIAGFFDNATSSNGSINVKRRGAGIFDFQCTSELLEGYPGTQVYLKHIFVLG